MWDISKKRIIKKVWHLKKKDLENIINLISNLFKNRGKAFCLLLISMLLKRNECVIQNLNVIL